MRLLVSAYACEPGRGSEPGVGWSVVRELAGRHQLTVLTRANHASAILESGEDWVGAVEWAFIDPSPAWCRIKHWPGMLPWFYLRWQQLAGDEARRRHRKRPFDAAHHLTFGNVLPPSPLAGLDLPFSCGPLGGGERVPERLLDDLPWTAKLREWLRLSSRELAARWPGLRAGYRRAECLAATADSAAWLRAAGARHVRVCAQSGIDAREVPEPAPLPEPTGSGGPLRFITACRLIRWKGVDLAIKALAAVREGGIEAELVVLNDGPERRRLEALARRLGVPVSFPGKMATLAAVHEAIAGADALVHPAWQEAFGQVCLEARAMGVPLIVLDHGGPAMIARVGEGAHRVAVGSRREVIDGLADAMRDVAKNRYAWRRAALESRPKVLAGFSWEQVAGEVEDAAFRATGRHPSPLKTP